MMSGRSTGTNLPQEARQEMNRGTAGWAAAERSDESYIHASIRLLVMECAQVVLRSL